MVRCYKALSNPPPSCYNLRKVKIHVRRLRSGNGGSSSCAGDQHPQLESPGPAAPAGGTPSRRTRFRYCWVFSALQEWWLKREGGWEGFWAEGAGAICQAFVWLNYCKAPYTLHWQRRARRSMTRRMGKLSFLSLLLSITRRMEKLVEGPLWNQAKAVRSPRAPKWCSSAGIGPGATAVKGGRAAGGGERDPTRSWPASPCRLLGSRDGRENEKCPFLFPCESVPPPAEKPALTLLRQHFCSGFFFPVALGCTDHSLLIY